MNEDTDNWNQDPGQSGGQPQQQPPQQQQYQQPPQHGPAPAKSKAPMLIGIIAVVAVVVILLVWMLMGSSSGLVGRWNADYMETSYVDPISDETQTQTQDMDGWIEFNSDGTGRASLFGETDDFTWEDIGNNVVRISPEGEESVEFDYSISGSTLTLEMSEGESTMKIVCQRA